jgi:DNA-binding response OmpR family regulator
MADVLLATDADWVADEVFAAVDGPGLTVRRINAGRDVLPAIEEAVPDLAVLDLQIGNMGGMAVCMAIRLEEGAGRLPHVPVLMLLDREPDVFLAKRSDADAWLVKPLDPFRLRRVAMRLLDERAAAEAAVEDDEEDEDRDEPAERVRTWRKRQRHPASG